MRAIRRILQVVQPVVQVERDANGWNLARLVKRQEHEADRQGPMRPVSLLSIEAARRNSSWSISWRGSSARRPAPRRKRADPRTA